MLTCSRNLRINLYTIQDDHFPKRKHQTSRSLKMSSRRKKLQDDYDIFQFLKNENTVDNYVTSLTERKEITHVKQNSVENKPKINLLQEKEKGFLKKFNEIQSKRKQEQLMKADYLLKKDLADLNKIATNSVQSFSNHFSLYNHFYFEHLIEPQTTRSDLQLPPKQIYSTIQNPNKKDITYQPPLPKPFINPQQLINEEPLEKVQQLNNRLKKVSVNLISKLDPESEQYFQLIQQGNLNDLHKLIINNPKILKQRTRLLETGLHVAVKRNKIQIVEYLLKNEIDEFAKDIWGQTARQIAFKLQYRNILKLLTYDQNS